MVKRKKHHQCNLQWVRDDHHMHKWLRQWLNKRAPPAQVAMSETTTCASGVFVSKVRVQGVKVRTSISVGLSRMQQQHATPTTTTTNQLRISTASIEVYDAAAIATCIRAVLGMILYCALHFAHGGFTHCNFR